MSDLGAHPETIALGFGASATLVGTPVLSPPVVAATSFYTAPGAVGFSVADLTDARPILLHALEQPYRGSS